MKLYLLTLDVPSSYSYDGTDSVIQGVFSSKKKASDIGESLLDRRDGIIKYNIEEIILDERSK